MEKRVSQAFDKVVYLLGKDKEGTYYWLEEPHWDCGWYWGFGYIESYTNNTDPKFSRDVASHEHAEDFYPKWFGSDDPILVEHTFSEEEGWELAELFAELGNGCYRTKSQWHTDSARGRPDLCLPKNLL